MFPLFIFVRPYCTREVRLFYCASFHVSIRLYCYYCVCMCVCVMAVGVAAFIVVCWASYIIKIYVNFYTYVLTLCIFMYMYVCGVYVRTHPFFILTGGRQVSLRHV